MIQTNEPMTEREMLDYIVKEIAELRASHNAILVLVSDIRDQVSPTLDALKSSPILKMLGV